MGLDQALRIQQAPQSGPCGCVFTSDGKIFIRHPGCIATTLDDIGQAMADYPGESYSSCRQIAMAVR